MPSKNTLDFLQTGAEGKVNDMLALLDEDPSNIDALDENRNNILHLALKGSHSKVVDALRRYFETHNAADFDVNALNKDGKTPLDIVNADSNNVEGKLIRAALFNLATQLHSPLFTSDALKEVHLLDMQIPNMNKEKC